MQIPKPLEFITCLLTIFPSRFSQKCFSSCRGSCTTRLSLSSFTFFSNNSPWWFSRSISICCWYASVLKCCWKSVRQRQNQDQAHNTPFRFKVFSLCFHKLKVILIFNSDDRISCRLYTLSSAICCFTVSRSVPTGGIVFNLLSAKSIQSNMAWI